MQTNTQAKIKEYNQLHLLKEYESLEGQIKEEFGAQLDTLDFHLLDLLKKKNGESSEEKGVIEPIKAVQIQEITQKADVYEQSGIQCLQQGKVAAVLLAGGQGTRLGSDKPKGMYNIGETKEVYIFQRIVENLLDVVNKIGKPIYLAVMTSHKNHEDTTAFFEEHNFFGYDKNYVMFFRQKMAPSVDYQGNILLEDRGRVSSSPNGNGGWFSSLMESGCLEALKKAGVEWLNVFAVDNVLQRIADPSFVGAVLQSGMASGAKVVRKASKDEKVGVMCKENGHPSIVEYYELTDEMRDELDENGEPAYNFGVILNYLFQVKALEQIVENELPVHIVEKKIPYITEDGTKVSPEEPNGYKFEELILDMIHMLPDCLPYEVDRQKEFAPVKNKEGVDSVESARALLKKNGYVI